MRWPPADLVWFLSAVAVAVVMSLRVWRLEQGIRAHRDARGDDRCWRDDEALYQLLPEGFTAEVLDSSVELERCRQFIQSRQNPRTVYVSPQRRIEALAKLQDFVAHDITCIGDESVCSCGLRKALKNAGLTP